MLKRLIIGEIPDDFDLSSDLLLGPWCIVGKEGRFPDFETYKFFPDPFSTPEALHKASLETVEYTNSYLPELAAELNLKNGTTHDLVFWRLMLLPWLITVIQTTWERQCRIRKFMDQYQEENISVTLMKDSVEWKFRNTQDFIFRGVLNLTYNEWLYSRLIEARLPPSWNVSYVEREIEYPDFFDNRKSWKWSIYNRFFKNLRCRMVYGISPISSIIWSLFLSLKPIRYKVDCSLPSIENRNACVNWGIDINDLLSETIPKCFLQLNELDTSSRQPRSGKLHLLGPVIYYDEPYMYKLAKCVEAGERLVLTQHGGNYGNMRTYPFPSSVEYAQYRFFSWGWREQDDYPGNIVPLPSPLLSKLSNKYKKENEDLILVGTRMQLCSHRLDSTPQPLEKISYRKNKISFLQHLEKDIIRNVSYRAYPMLADAEKIGSLQDFPYVKAAFPMIRNCEGELHAIILRCKLLVLDHPGATLNIALATNIPTIGFWDKNAWSLCHQAEPYFSELEKAGILFEVAEEAANQVNQIWKNVNGWWNKHAVQQARQRWCFEYARSDRFWWWHWLKILWSI